jgi:hypothetical protein
MLEVRMKKSRLSKTILDVDESENETEERATLRKQVDAPKMPPHQTRPLFC